MPLKPAKLLFKFVFILTLGSCKPVINSFDVSPAVVTGEQKVTLQWDVKGVPSLEFNEHISVDSVELLEYTLIVRRAGKEVRKTVQVQKMKSDSIEITLATNRLEGDLAVASGENNNRQWDGFTVLWVRSESARDITVQHAGRTATLSANGSPSPAFSGTSAAGEWIFKTRLSAGEKADSTRIPESLKIKAVIKRQKQ